MNVGARPAADIHGIAAKAVIPHLRDGPQCERFLEFAELYCHARIAYCIRLLKTLGVIMKKPIGTSFGRLIYILAALMTLAFVPYAQAESSLWDAVTNNDLGKAKTLITFGAGVNQRNHYGNPILHHAVSVGNAEMVELLISKGADVNLKGQFDRVALHYANKKGMAKILLTHGAVVDAPTNFGETPLHWAASGVNSFGKQVDLIEFAETLIANGADVNKKTGEGRSYRAPLTYAAGANNLPVARVLLAHGADVEGGGSSPLSYAGSNGDFVEMAQFLVENGAKVNQPSPSGWYPLMTASGRGNVKVVNYLLSQGADPNAADKAGFTALYSAAGSDYGASSAEALLNKGANPNAKTIHGLTALHQAASQGAIETMKVLIAHKADVDARDNEGYSPMYGAINLGGYRKGGMEVIEVLLKNGANVNSKNNRGYGMPLHAAINRNDFELVRLLLSYGSEIDSIARNLADRSKEMSDLIRTCESQKLTK